MSKKRYAVGFYNESERRDDPEWTDNRCNRLVNYIYDNQELFNIRYKTSDESGNRTWFIFEPDELNKARDHFNNNNDTDVLEWIDICTDYDKWQTSCMYCDSISINTIPYTYREYYGTIGREYNCPMCSGLLNEYAYEVGKAYNDGGADSAIDLLIDINEGRFVLDVSEE